MPTGKNAETDEGTRQQLLEELRSIVRRRRLTQAAVAQLLGIQQPKVSALLRGQSENFSTARLLRFLTSLSKDVEILVSAKSPRRPTGRVRVRPSPSVSTHVTLADATDIAAWADRQDSRGTLPRLVRNLLLGSNRKVDQVSFRAGEGTDLGGWDGFAVCSEGDAHIPTGASGWELSVRKDVAAKATEDYLNRLGALSNAEAAQTTFVFVTARRWGGKLAWTQARIHERRWRSVIALDADDLEAWLELTPAVHIWFSHLLGKRAEAAVDIRTFWADWSQGTRPVLACDFLLAGRERTVSDIRDALTGPSPSFSVRAESRDEALAVFCASIESAQEPDRSTWLSSALIVRSATSWERLAQSRVPLILVPLFDDLELISGAIRAGHKVVIPTGPNQPATSTTIEVSRLAVDNATKSLETAGVPAHNAAQLAVLGRRSMTALRRTLSIRPELQQPKWADPSIAPSLLPAMLAGSWNEASEGDVSVLASLAQTAPERVLDDARRWSREADAPVRVSGNIWYVASREDSWRLLAPALSHSDIGRLEAAVLRVLGTADPRLDIEPDKRWFSVAQGPYSSALIRGLSETLAVLGARGNDHEVRGAALSEWAEVIVAKLLAMANGDWRLWATLSSELPLLAEAAPKSFLMAVEEGLRGEAPVFSKLFDEPSGNPFFGSPHYTGLIWALERLAWSDVLLPHATLLLAGLAQLDPSGKWGNRPDASLRETFILWRPQTAATWAQQLLVLRTLLAQVPAVGWKLCTALLPRYHDSSQSRTRPRWRDWAPEDEPQVTVGEHAAHVADVVAAMLSLVGTDGARWKDLIEALPNLPVNAYEDVLKQLKELSELTTTDADRATVWNALRDLVAQHRSFSTADWALAEQHVNRLADLLARFEPTDTLSRFGWLFKHHVRLENGDAKGWRESEAAVGEARVSAVRSIYEHEGMGALERLSDRVENPGALGEAFGLAVVDDTDEDQLLWRLLANENPRLRQFARGFVGGRSSSLGHGWAEGKLSLPQLTIAQRAELLTLLPNERTTWGLAESDPRVEELYWNQVRPRAEAGDLDYVARRLVRYQRAYAAAELIAFHLKDSPTPATELIADVLDAMLAQEKPDAVSDGLSYWIGELLDALAERADIDEARVAKVEWAFAAGLSHDRPPKVLHRELERNPSFFVQLLSWIYRREDQDEPSSNDANAQRATNAYRVVGSWKSMPGIQASGDVKAASLEDWVSHALAEGKEVGRPTVTGQHVGKVLANSPEGRDGAWPHEVVRDLIERLQSREVELGLEIGIYNKRGVIRRSLQEGGRQERELANRYKAWAAKLSERWPRTAGMLRRIETTYRDEARREDREAELHEDGMW